MSSRTPVRQNLMGSLDSFLSMNFLSSGGWTLGILLCYSEYDRLEVYYRPLVAWATDDRRTLAVICDSTVQSASFYWC